VKVDYKKTAFEMLEKVKRYKKFSLKKLNHLWATVFTVRRTI